MARPVNMELTKKMIGAYERFCKPLCRETNLCQTALDILMFLANNPELCTAKDIVQIRSILPSLVSINVEKLVQEGYLLRQAAPDDRRKVLLSCTDKAAPIVQRGRYLQAQFQEALLQGVSPQDLEVFTRVLDTVSGNAGKIMGAEETI